jgi:hypothetical protein
MVFVGLPDHPLLPDTAQHARFQAWLAEQQALKEVGGCGGVGWGAYGKKHRVFG